MANGLVVYIKESIEELKKVVWPTKDETIRNTIVVSVLSIFVASFLGGSDYLLNNMLKFLVK